MVIEIGWDLTIRINGKPVDFTLHVRDEIDRHRKDTLFVCEVIDRGEKRLVSKRERKYESLLELGKTRWIVSWFDKGERILAKHFAGERR